MARGRRPPGTDIDVADAEFHQGGVVLHEIATPENQLMKDELEALVYKALSDLPDDLRTAVTLREFDGLSYEDIAEVMDCPVGTVRSRIFRGREAIDNRIKSMVA